MSNLDKIIELLSNNLELEIMVSQKPNDSLKRSQIINICLAPKVDIMESNNLQRLLTSIKSAIKLKSGMEPSQNADYPTHTVTGWYHFGYIRYDEVLGQTTITERNVLSVKDEFSLTRFGGAKKSIEWKEPIKRETFVRLFPHIALAKINHQEYQRSPIFETRASLLSHHHE